MQASDIQDKQPMQTEKERYDRFIETHTKYKARYHEASIEYYYSGKGENTLLLLPHISSLVTQDMAFHHILNLEKENRVLAPELGNMVHLDDIAEAMNLVLEKENIAEVILWGQSGSGMTAQVFFNRYPHKVKAMILIHTIAPRPDGRDRSWLLKAMKWVPDFLIQNMLRKKFSKYSKGIAIPEESVPRIMFSRFLLNRCFLERYSKKKLLQELRDILKFNEEPILTSKDLPDWHGRILIITGEDDPGYEDSKKLAVMLPHAELFVFEPGYGHLAPAIKSDEFYSTIDRFLNTL